MKKFFSVALVAMSLTSSVFALTDEQRKEFDERFKASVEYTEGRYKDQDINKQEMEESIASIKKEKEEIEANGDQAIEKYLKDMHMDEDLTRYLAGAFSLYLEGSVPNESFNSGYFSGIATFGPQFWFGRPKGSWGFSESHGGYIKIPIGLGFAVTNGVFTFTMPIGIEGGYRSKEFGGFGIGAGLRYTFNPQEAGTVHMMDVYASIDIWGGFFTQVGYIFYSSQDVNIKGFRGPTIDPYKGQIKITFGWRL